MQALFLFLLLSFFLIDKENVCPVMYTPKKSYKQFTLPKQLQHFSSSSSLIKTIPKNYECILFPTYAKRSSEGKKKTIYI